MIQASEESVSCYCLCSLHLTLADTVTFYSIHPFYLNSHQIIKLNSLRRPLLATVPAQHIHLLRASPVDWWLQFHASFRPSCGSISSPLVCCRQCRFGFVFGRRPP